MLKSVLRSQGLLNALCSLVFTLSFQKCASSVALFSAVCCISLILPCLKLPSHQTHLSSKAKSGKLIHCSSNAS